MLLSQALRSTSIGYFDWFGSIAKVVGDVLPELLVTAPVVLGVVVPGA